MNHVLTPLFLILLFLASCSQKGNPHPVETRQISDEIDWQDIYYKRVAAAKGWKFILVHHSATHAGNAQSFHEYHTQRGYGGLAYHFVIGNGRGAKDGEIQEGFRWKQQISGTHLTVNAWYHNIFGIGICLVGNFDKYPPTKKQIRSLVGLIKKLAREHGLNRNNVMGHGSAQHSEISYSGNQMTVQFIPGKKEMRTCPGKYFSMKKVLKLAFGE